MRGKGETLGVLGGGKKGPWDPLVTDMRWILGSVGCGVNKGLWDRLVTDMGWDLGSMGSHYGGVEVTQGCGTPWIQIWGSIWGLWGLNVTQGMWVTLWGCGGDTGLWAPLVTDMGWILRSVGCGGKKGPWDPLVTDMGWDLGSWLGSVGCGINKGL